MKAEYSLGSPSVIISVFLFSISGEKRKGIASPKNQSKTHLCIDGKKALPQENVLLSPESPPRSIRGLFSLFVCSVTSAAKTSGKSEAILLSWSVHQATANRTCWVLGICMALWTRWTYSLGPSSEQSAFGKVQSTNSSTAPSVRLMAHWSCALSSSLPGRLTLTRSLSALSNKTMYDFLGSDRSHSTNLAADDDDVS